MCTKVHYANFLSLTASEIVGPHVHLLQLMKTAPMHWIHPVSIPLPSADSSEDKCKYMQAQWPT